VGFRTKIEDNPAINCGAKYFLAEVVVFGDGFGDTPGAFEAVGKDNEVAGAEGYGVVFVGDRYLALEDETGFLFGVGPVECARLAFPDGPGFAFFRFGVRRFFYDDVFNGRHFVLLRLLFLTQMVRQAHHRFRGFLINHK
jgi:hypothetical protein